MMGGNYMTELLQDIDHDNLPGMCIHTRMVCIVLSINVICMQDCSTLIWSYFSLFVF